MPQEKQPYSQRKGIVEDEPEDFSYEKSVGDIETSHSATSSTFAVFTSGSERATKVMKRYKLKKKFGRHSVGFKDTSSQSEKMRGVGRVDLTPKREGEVTKNSYDEDARLFRAKNSHKKERYTKRNRNQVTACVTRPRRRRHRGKTLKQLKQSRSSTSRNALLEGLGYSASPSK